MATTDASRPMRADARRNYERIVGTAREVFGDCGPEAPLDDIARRAGVGPGTLYRHFPTREKLMEAVYREDIATLSEAAYALLESRSPEDALAEWTRMQVDFALGRSGLARALKAAMDKEGETFAWCKATLREAADAILVRAKGSGAVRDDIRPVDLLRLAHAVATASDQAEEGSADRMLSIMLAGLRPQ